MERSLRLLFFVKSFKKSIDKQAQMCYNIYNKEREEQIMTKSYWKSTYTGEIYEMEADWKPKFGGWERTTEEEYKKFIKKMGYRV